MAKVSKASVNYRPTAKGAAKRCGTCVMFRRLVPWLPEGRCTLVAGRIDATDTCDRWEKRQ